MARARFEYVPVDVKTVELAQQYVRADADAGRRDYRARWAMERPRASMTQSAAGAGRTTGASTFPLVSVTEDGPFEPLRASTRPAFRVGEEGFRGVRGGSSRSADADRGRLERVRIRSTETRSVRAAYKASTAAMTSVAPHATVAAVRRVWCGCLRHPLSGMTTQIAADESACSRGRPECWRSTGSHPLQVASPLEGSRSPGPR